MTPKQYQLYKQAQIYLEKLPKLTLMRRGENPALGLERTKILLHALGNPERGFQYIHITGTSGKGSVTLMLHEILLAAGKRVGSYFSPHVTTTTERIYINGRLVSVPDFLWAFNKVRSIVDQTDKVNHPSHFEALFAMSLLIFHKHRVQWVVLEVGAGGQFDPTNAIPAPKVAIVTNIGLDHQQLLGRTRSQIARTKAGIFKPGSKVFTAESDPKIRKILKCVAHKSSCPLTYVPTPKNTIKLKLAGFHQQHNAALAYAVSQYLHIPKHSIEKGLFRVCLPGRFEIITRWPDIILDGAHNRDKVSALMSVLRTAKYHRIHAVVGACEHKDARALLRPLLPYVDEWFCTRVKQVLPKPLNPKKLAATIRQLRPSARVHVARPASTALQQARLSLGPKDAIVVTGSFYLVGELRQQWYSEKSILSQQTSFPHAKN
jgi:dihydrofolate synthase / folylpolyglutamate synthase